MTVRAATAAAAPSRVGDARPPLADRLLAWRDALLASPRFQRWAAAFPLTRPVALRRSRQLFDLCAGFVYSQTLLACVRAGLFDVLAEGPATPAALRARLGLGEDAAARLLGAALALELVEHRTEGRLGLGPLGAPMAGNAALAAMVEHNALLYDDLRDPLALLRGDAEPRLGAYWGYARTERPAELGPGQVAGYSGVMAASQPLVAAEVLDAYPLRGHRRLLDVGGGEGGFACAAAARWPGLHVAVFDLPAVARRAADRLAHAGLSDRSTTVGGDFLADPLPGGADVATLVRVLHDHDDHAALALLRRVHAALEPGGAVVVAEPMAGARGAESVGAAYFAFYLLAMGSGRARSAAEYRELLREAGFRDARAIRPRLPVQTSIVVALR